MRFLSTLSLRRATIAGVSKRKGGLISIHALLAESDPRDCPASSPRRYFYPRSPCGERRGPKLGQFLRPLISIHALLAEGDYVLPVPRPPQINFYPRSPCGERQSRGSVSMPRYRFLSTLSLRRATRSQEVRRLPWQFLSTLSLRRATNLCQSPQATSAISIHALLAESDGT